MTNYIVTLLACKVRKQSPQGTVWYSVLGVAIFQWRGVVVGNQKLDLASASDFPAHWCICRASMPGIVDQNGVSLFNSVVKRKGLNFVHDRSPRSSTITEVPDLRTWYAQVPLQIISHSICIRDRSHQVWDFGRFILVDSDNQREEMRR